MAVFHESAVFHGAAMTSFHLYSVETFPCRFCHGCREMSVSYACAHGPVGRRYLGLGGGRDGGVASLREIFLSADVKDFLALFSPSYYFLLLGRHLKKAKVLCDDGT